MVLDYKFAEANLFSGEKENWQNINENGIAQCAGNRLFLT
jgi:hypothetical protein